MSAKVLLVNGSPHARGCTFTALSEIAEELGRQGVDSEIVQVRPDTSGCRACRACKSTGRCVIDDQVNEIGDRMDEFDGLVLGSPVYYAGPSGQICAFADRLFYSHGSRMALKPAAAVVSCRRAGSTVSLDRLNKYFMICQMPVVASQYWNMVHGNTPDEVRRDEEGLQTMRILARNMAWLIKCQQAGDAAGVPRPEREPPKQTNFIRGD